MRDKEYKSNVPILDQYWTYIVNYEVNSDVMINSDVSIELPRAFRDMSSERRDNASALAGRWY